MVTMCRACKSPNLFPYLYLGEVPPANNLESKKKFPIQVLVCEDCYLSQLSVVVEPKYLYSNYPYHSSISNTFKLHCRELAMKLQGLKMAPNPLIVDIASNDGCFMEQARSIGFNRFLGIEPSENLASECIRKGFPCANKFWSEDTARFYRDKSAQGASFIVAQNVLAHVDDLHDFLNGVKYFLEDDGVFVAEFPYMMDLVKGNQFDTIYHEHLSYFLLNPLNNLFASVGLPIFKVERTPIHGGSIRIYASKNYYEREDSIMEMLSDEESEGFYHLSTYVDFATRVFEMGSRLIQVLENLKSSKIMGYGASAKGISLINYFGLGRYIKSIVDDTPDKQGKMTPGEAIPIVDFSHFEKEKPDYIILLAWNFASELMAKTKHLNAYYIIPIPKAEIV